MSGNILYIFKIKILLFWCHKNGLKCPDFLSKISSICRHKIPLEMSRLPIIISVISRPNMSGNLSSVFLKTPGFVPPTWLEMSWHPAKSSSFCHHKQVWKLFQGLVINIRSCCPIKKYISFLSGMSGNSPKVLLKTPGFVAPTRLQKSQLPVRNIQLLSRLNWLEISHHQVSFIPIHPLFYYIFKVLHYPVGVVSLQASSV